MHYPSQLTGSPCKQWNSFAHRNSLNPFEEDDFKEEAEEEETKKRMKMKRMMKIGCCGFDVGGCSYKQNSLEGNKDCESS